MWVFERDWNGLEKVRKVEWIEQSDEIIVVRDALRECSLEAAPWLLMGFVGLRVLRFGGRVGDRVLTGRESWKLGF